MARKINDNTYVVLPALEAELQELYNRKSATQRDANATPAVLNEIAANIFSAQNACDTGRVPYDTATRAVTSFETGMSGLVSQYNGYVAARDAAQRSLNANKATIDTNTKVVIPGYVAEQKKVKSTSAEYKALASQIAAVKAENTRLGKLNTDPKTGFQKQYNDAVAALKKMDIKTSEYSKKKVELERLKKVAASLSLPTECSEVQGLRNQKAEQETLVRQSKENATSVLAGIDAEIAAVLKRKRDIEKENSALYSKLREKTGGNSGSSVSPLPNDLVQKKTIDDEYAAKWNRLSQEQEMARAARAQQLQECLDTANAELAVTEEEQETPAEACERMYGSAESVESAGCGNGAIDAGACRICPMGEILDNNICTSRASFDDMLRQVREEQANQAAQAAEAAARANAELAQQQENERLAKEGKEEEEEKKCDNGAANYPECDIHMKVCDEEDETCTSLC